MTMYEKRAGRTSLRRQTTWPKRRSLSAMAKKSLIQTSAQPARPNRIRINVGGTIHETYRSTLRAIPDTRLAWLTESSARATADYDPTNNEYFFDRHPGMFGMILNYYRTGKLHVPVDVCGPIFEEELAFWGIEEDQIESCCWTTYRSHRDAQETLKELNIQNEDKEEEEEPEEVNRYIKERFGIEALDDEEPTSCWSRYRPKVWTLLENPNSSHGAKVMAMISLLFVLISITTFCLESVAVFRIPLNQSDPLTDDWTTWRKNTESRPVQAIVVLDYVCVVFFTIEFVVRLTFCDDRRRFLMAPLNWIEVWAIVPFYVEQIVIATRPELQYNIYMQVLRSMRLIRIFRIFKLTRHFSGLKILWKAIKASAKELLLLILFLFISVLIFACLVYYAESIDESPQNDFKNIPLGFWWAVVTMTTLGYGDMYPRTGFGYVIGVVCSVCGVLVLALPVPVIVNNFSLYYSHAQAQMKLPKKHKRILAGAPDDLKAALDPDDQHDDGGSDTDNDSSDPSGENSQRRRKHGSTGGDLCRTNSASGCSDKAKSAMSKNHSPLGNSNEEADQPKGKPGGIKVAFIDETIHPSRSMRRTFTRKVSPIPELAPLGGDTTPEVKAPTSQTSGSTVDVTKAIGSQTRHRTDSGDRQNNPERRKDDCQVQSGDKANKAISVSYIDKDTKTLSVINQRVGNTMNQGSEVPHDDKPRLDESNMANGHVVEDGACPRS